MERKSSIENDRLGQRDREGKGWAERGRECKEGHRGEAYRKTEREGEGQSGA